MKRLIVIILAVTAALACGLIYLDRSGYPPPESRLIANFHQHRAAYERLREMLQEDSQLERVADWGIETEKEPWKSYRPPEGDFPVDRYRQYLSLLKDTGGLSAYRLPGVPAKEVGVLAWARGFAGETRHINICWVAHAPANKVASLDAFYNDPNQQGPVYRPIEGGWYLWADR